MNNSGVGRIIFEEFPGNKRKNGKFKKLFSQLKINKLVFIILIVLILFFISSFFNLKYLDSSLNDKYKLIDKTTEEFANIKDRKKLFYDIGFKTVRQTEKTLNDNFYECTEARGEILMEDYQDLILIYYDIDNKVKKVDFELIFKEKDFAYKNLNAVLKNFVDVDINKVMIQNVMENANSVYSDEQKNISLEYQVLSYNYKRLKVEIER